MAQCPHMRGLLPAIHAEHHTRLPCTRMMHVVISQLIWLPSISEERSPADWL